jgi:hypothetical protein
VLPGATDLATGLRVAFASQSVKTWASELPDSLHPQISPGNTTPTTTPATSTSSPAASPAPPVGQVIIAGHELGWKPQTTPDICKGGTLELTITLVGIPAATKVDLALTGNGLPPSLTLALDPGKKVTRDFTVPGSKGPTTWTSQILTIGGKAPPSSGAHVAAFAQCPTT